MTEYRYDNVSIDNLAVVAMKIERTIGIAPTGLSDAGDTTSVMFAADLSAANKTSLDTLMTTANVDQIPVGAGTNYRIDDFFDTRAAIKTAVGVDFVMFPSGNSWVIQFVRVLTSQEKTRMTTQFSALLKVI